MYAVATSGGKDSTLALHRALAQGLRVTHLFHVYGVEYGRVRFHGYRPEMLSAQAEALGLEIIIESTRADEFDEDFSRALEKVKEAGLCGVIFGNILLEDVSQYYRERVESVGLQYLDVLWQQDTAALLAQFVEEGFRAIVTSVWLKHLGREYVGRSIDRQFVADITGLEGVDPCGENGEYHSLVYDGPCFDKPLRYTTHGIHEEPENLFLDVRPVPSATG